ncbi:uncharacterized protein LOC128995235 isoform X3 [Macrosteles quadrilineatus]|uniref:uncharacterized protein LOC128995235 isoform X3 n=1 Tax=Macrosteles quadrilineatus TaxID=74068 RepID=UPI0023E1D487|nr:uncharacterized protein LOC128995235 isoform X3 [Macrosteles quadrilineatus]
MNGAAMNYQDQSLRPHYRESSGLRNPGNLQMNCQQNLQPQNSKTLNYQLPSNYPVDDYSSNLHQCENFSDSRHSVQEIEHLRLQRLRAMDRRKEPMDLPVPRFVVDENSVSCVKYENKTVTEGSKGLDLDTRIGMLLKSKALAGMHPIFSDLNDSEESGSDLDDPLLSRPRYKPKKGREIPTSIEDDMDLPVHESFDDPERPLSRPPSPFLSRATYLFWFNKAIEIKQQAQAQEQELLEQATKRLIQESSRSKKDLSDPQKIPVPQPLLDEISKELKEVIKQEFIREVIEQTAFHTLDDWWEQQNQKTDGSNIENRTCNTSIENCNDLSTENKKSQGSTSPTLPYPHTKSREEAIEKKNFNSDSINQNQKMCKNTAPKTNNEVNVSDTYSLPQDEDILMNGVSVKNQDYLSQEFKPEEVKKENELNCQEDTNKLLEKLDDCVSEKLKKREKLLTFDSSKPCELECLSKIPKTSQLSPLNNPVDCTSIDKFDIVKDIIDLICDRVNKIIVQRDVSNQELN